MLSNEGKAQGGLTSSFNLKLSEVDYLMFMTCVYVKIFQNIFLFTITTNISCILKISLHLSGGIANVS